MDKHRQQIIDWHRQNREHIYELQQKNDALKREIAERKKITTAELLKRQHRLNLFEVLDVLKKDNDCYLWNKSVTIWNDNDFEYYFKLRDK